MAWSVVCFARSKARIGRTSTLLRRTVGKIPRINENSGRKIPHGTSWRVSGVTHRARSGIRRTAAGKRDERQTPQNHDKLGRRERLGRPLRLLDGYMRPLSKRIFDIPRRPAIVFKRTTSAWLSTVWRPTPSRSTHVTWCGFWRDAFHQVLQEGLLVGGISIRPKRRPGRGRSRFPPGLARPILTDGLAMEPAVGVEPTTLGLRYRCSTTELSRRQNGQSTIGLWPCQVPAPHGSPLELPQPH